MEDLQCEASCRGSYMKMMLLAIMMLLTTQTKADPCAGDGEVLTAPGGPYTSPGYQQDGGGAYENDITCLWNITAPQGMRILINFTDMNIDEDDTVAVHDLEDGLVAESEEEADLRLTYSSSNALNMTFVTDGSVVRNGFQFYIAFFNSGPCSAEGEEITEGVGTFTSEGYRNNNNGTYGANANCKWTFVVETGFKLHLNFMNFSIEDGYDEVIVYNVDSGETIDTYSGEDLEPFSPDPFNHSVMLLFSTDESYQDKGFLVSYQYTAPVSENACVSDPAPSEGDIVSCDCSVRYLKHTSMIAANAAPCLAPPHLVGVPWDNIEERELTCSSAQAQNSDLVRAVMLRPHRIGFCAWPPVASQHHVTSLMDCAVLCMEAPDCIYINVKAEMDGTFVCGVTSFVVEMPADAVADPDNWTSYLVAN